MVVISRMRDETIVIGDDIEVTIVDIRGDKVRLGISYPSGVSVHRKEVYVALRLENREAAATPGASAGPGGGQPLQKAGLPVVTPLPLGRYRHYKGKEYEVIGIARHSETQEELVVYRALYGEGGLWVRPKKMFTETVEVDGRTVPRFQHIER